MVYCGKPSKGCKNCRERKIRCNQAAPSCAQCVKAGKECPGYRNMLDLSFRDESEHVIKKAKAKARKRSPVMSGQSSAPRQRPSSGRTSRSETVPSSSAPSTRPTGNISALSASDPAWLVQDLDVTGYNMSTFSMTPSVSELGFNFFIVNFVATPSGPSHGYFPSVSYLFRNNALDDTLKASIAAAGLAGYASRIKSSQLIAQARREYATSLQKINASLRSPSEAVKDSTLLSILIVAVFETIAGAKKLSLKEWTEHVIGAATLLKLRGRSQLTTQVGFGLFLAACSHILLSCMQRETSMPLQLIELRIEAFHYVPSDPGWDYLKMMDQFSIFRAAVKSGHITDPEAIITQALKLDGELMEIFAEVPLEWIPERVYTDTKNELVWNGCYDIYYDCWVSQIYNAMRSTRIMLNEMIRFRLLEGFASTPQRFTALECRAQFQASSNTCVEMRDAILRSVPQHCGYVSRKPFTSPYSSHKSSPPPPGMKPFKLGDNITSFTRLLADTDLSILGIDEPFLRDPSSPMIGGYFLLWPLYVAGITRVSTLDVKKHVVKTLRYIGNEIGFRQGVNLADFMEAHSMTGEQDLGGMNVPGKKFIRPLLQMLAKDEEERVSRMNAISSRSGSLGVD